jgi:AraC-like DNA-binding protein
MDVLTDVLAATKIGGVVSARLNASAPWGVRMGDAPVAAFHAVSQGTCWLRRPGAAPLQLVAGDITVLPTGGSHTLASDPQGPATPFEELVRSRRGPLGQFTIPGPGPQAHIICGAYHYDAFATHPLLTLLPPVLHLPADQSAARQDVTRTLVMLAGEVDANRPGSATIVDRLADVLLVHILRLWTATHPDAGASWLMALSDPVVARSMELMHEHPGHSWTVEALAEEIGVSRPTLARRFTALVGESPHAYLTRWRLELAARQLRDTDDPLGAIAQHVGYATEFAFSRAFSRARGTAPGQYRATHQQSRQTALTEY